jgi:hypothetical protein
MRHLRAIPLHATCRYPRGMGQDQRERPPLAEAYRQWAHREPPALTDQDRAELDDWLADAQRQARAAVAQSTRAAEDADADDDADGA